MISLKWKVQCSHSLHLAGLRSGLCHLSTSPGVLSGTKLSSKSWKGIAVMVRPWQLSRSQNITFLQKVYRQNCAPEPSACHPPLLRLYEVSFPGKLLFLKSAFEPALKHISTRTSFELRKHKCYFPTFHWWSMAIQTLQLMHHPAPVMSLAASVLPASLKGRGHDKSLCATRTQAMAKKSDRVPVTITS